MSTSLNLKTEEGDIYTPERTKVWPPSRVAKEGKYPKQYLNSCLNPNCPSNHGSEVVFEVEGSSWDADGDTVAQDVECIVCGAYWRDIYTLTHYCNLELP